MEHRTNMKPKENKKDWRGDKARPSNRANTWGRDKCPKQDRRTWSKQIVLTD